MINHNMITDNYNDDKTKDGIIDGCMIDAINRLRE